MIYFYIQNSDYINYNLVINYFLDYFLGNKIIKIDNYDEIILHVKKNNLIDNLKFIFLNKYLDIFDEIKNFYIFLLTDNYNNLLINQKIITYNFQLKKNNLKFNKNIHYFPFKINKEFIPKNNDISIYFENKSKYFDKINIFLENKDLKYNKIDNLNRDLNFILSHKIFINFNNDILSEYICLNCIYNKVIVINNIKTKFNNTFIDNFIYYCNYRNLEKYIDYVLNNYNLISNYNLNIFNLDRVNNLLIKNINFCLKNNFLQNKVGFIILRHVNCENTNRYWIESYKCIRKYYNNKIIIIDDNSDTNFLNSDLELINCEIINSEFKGRGEILPYYYLYKFKLFDKAMIIHDSVFINKYINIYDIYNIKFIWDFPHDWDDENAEINLLNVLNNDQLKDFYYKKDEWVGCFGNQSIIDYTFLKKIEDKYNIFKLIDYINDRNTRMNFERIFGLISIYENYKNKKYSLYGRIHHYIHWGYLFESYLEDKKNDKLENYEIIKVWSGR